MRIYVVPYDDAWPAMFEAERSHPKEMLEDNCYQRADYTSGHKPYAPSFIVS